VTNFLAQYCQIPLTNVLSPDALGTGRQVAHDMTSEAKTENRRVVVRILQNKNIASTSKRESAYEILLGARQQEGHLIGSVTSESHVLVKSNPGLDG
jgi:hypothetical protein